MSIADKLTRLTAARDDTRTALAAKGQSVSTHGFEDFPDDIAAISAADLVSGTKSITSSGTHDVTDYAKASVAAGSAATPTATKGTVSNHSISVTPKVVNSAGYISGGTKTGTAVTVSASELVSGTLSITANGTSDVTNYAAVSVNVSGGGSVIPSDLPSDGKTRICYDIPSDAQTHGKTITLMFYQATSSTRTTVDWGDGSTATNSTGSGRKTLTHTYSSTGEKIVSITIGAGTIYFGGGSSYTIYGAYSAASTIYLRKYIKWIVLGTGVTKLDTSSLYYCFNLREIQFPASGFTTIESHAFDYCVSLEQVTIPNTVTTLGSYAFQYCFALKKAVLPTNTTLTMVNSYTFGYCYSLESITIPSQFTTLDSYAFVSCYNLKSFTIPSSVTSIPTAALSGLWQVSYLSIPSTVTSIAAYGLNYLYSLQKLRFNSATPPRVANSNAFASLPTTCVISVPTGKLSAYTSAANYPSSSSYTYIEEAS